MKIVKHISDFKHNWLKILHSKRLSPLAKILQFTLLSCNTKKYRPQTDNIAKQFNVSPSTLDRAISELRKTGYLKSYGKKDKCIWHVYDTPEYIDTTGGANDNNDKHQNIDTTGGATLLYNECGGKNIPPHSTSEEIILPPKPFGEMTKEEWDNYLPF